MNVFKTVARINREKMTNSLISLLAYHFKSNIEHYKFVVFSYFPLHFFIRVEFLPNSIILWYWFLIPLSGLTMCPLALRPVLHLAASLICRRPFLVCAHAVIVVIFYQQYVYLRKTFSTAFFKMYGWIEHNLYFVYVVQTNE